MFLIQVKFSCRRDKNIFLSEFIGSPSGEPMFSLCRKWTNFAGHCTVTWCYYLCSKFWWSITASCCKPQVAIFHSHKLDKGFHVIWIKSCNNCGMTEGNSGTVSHRYGWINLNPWAGSHCQRNKSTFKCERQRFSAYKNDFTVPDETKVIAIWKQLHRICKSR